MALLLEEASKLAQDQLRAGVIETFVQNSPILERMDFLPIAGNAYSYNQEGALPGVAFRGVNESYTPSTGVINPQSETLRIAGGELDVDAHITRTRGMGVRSAHEGLKIKALARSLNKAVFDGNSAVNPREFDGLNRRLTGAQKILAGAGGAALTMLMVDDLLAAVPGANAIMVGEGGKSLLTRLLRGNSQVTTTVDAFGRQLTMYAGIPILNVGKDSTNGEILGFDEDPGDGVFDTTSLYAARFGSADAEQDFFGISNGGGMLVKDIGEMESKPAYRTRVEWDISMVLAAPDCAGRLYGVLNAVA
jgi:hypothetical protein